MEKEWVRVRDALRSVGVGVFLEDGNLTIEMGENAMRQGITLDRETLRAAVGALKSAGGLVGRALAMVLAFSGGDDE